MGATTMVWGADDDYIETELTVGSKRIRITDTDDNVIVAIENKDGKLRQEAIWMTPEEFDDLIRARVENNRKALKVYRAISENPNPARDE